MADITISSEDMRILDRMSNLRSSDSTIIMSIEKKKSELISDKEEKVEKNNALGGEIDLASAKISKLKEQKDKFVDDFKGYDRDNYIELLTALSIPFDPQAIVAQVQEQAPAFIREVQDDLKVKKEEQSVLKEEIKEADINIGQCEQKLDAAKATQNTLNKMLEDILSGINSITAEDVKVLFRNLEFTEAEVNQIGSILLFSDKFKVYDEMTKTPEISGKNVAEVMSEQLETAQEDAKKSEEPINELSETEAVANEEEATKEISTEAIIELGRELPEDEQEGVVFEDEEPAVEAEPEVQEEEKKTNNEDLLKELGIVNNEKALTDEELAAKVDLLKANGKQVIDIRFGIDTITSMTLAEIENAIEKAKEAGLKIGDLPIVVLDRIEKLVANMMILNKYDILADEKEIKNHAALIANIDTEVLETNIKTCVEYKVGFKKVNGKIPFTTIINDILTVVQNMDKIIEFGEPGIITTRPELLASDIDRAIAQMEFMSSTGMEYNSDGKYKAIKTGKNDLDIENTKPTMEENNTTLASVIGNTCIDTIKASQKDPEYITAKTDEETSITYNALEQSLEGIAEVKEDAVIIEGVAFSKNKFRRNATCLISKKVDEPNNVVMFASLATDSTKTPEEIQRVAQVMGFNLAMGGR